jgi:ketosteroid isomerase-like protein
LELMGMGTRFEGVAAIRGFVEDWLGGYEEYESEAEEVVDLGSGVTSCVVVQKGRPVGSSGVVEQRSACVTTFAEGLVVRTTLNTDVDEGRAAAERLAQERTQANG